MNQIESLLRTLFVMVWMVEARDPYTGGHLWRVSQFSRRTAEAANLPESEIMRAMLGGFLHDLGKIGVPDAILRKPGSLTDEEYDVIKTHPEIGRRLLAGHPLRGLVEAAVHLHHERPDGRGYPKGVIADAIPQEARIVGICDAFDAMTSSRPYRKGMPVERALQIIEENLGSQFDIAMGTLFVSLGKEGALQDIVGHSEPGIPLEICPGCGPIIVRTRRHHTGDTLYCPNCTGEYTLHVGEGQSSLTPSGKHGSPEQLIPAFNEDLCGELIDLAQSRLPPPQENKTPWWRQLWA
jgi:hypothetical protein